MDLLSAADRLEIRAALQDVIDTFHKTTVSYYLAGSYQSDFMEDQETKQYTLYEFPAYVEYPKTMKEETVEGAYDGQDVWVQVGLDNLQALNLIDAEFQPLFRPELDYMLINGARFNITSCKTEGAFEKENILVILTGRKEPLYS